MRTVELVLLAGVAVAVAWPAVFGSRPRRGLVAGVLVLAVIAQLQIEGYRWQMLPIYIAAVGLAAGDIFYLDRDLPLTSRIFRGGFGTLGVALLALIPLAFLAVDGETVITITL